MNAAGKGSPPPLSVSAPIEQVIGAMPCFFLFYLKRSLKKQSPASLFEKQGLCLSGHNLSRGYSYGKAHMVCSKSMKYVNPLTPLLYLVKKYYGETFNR